MFRFGYEAYRKPVFHTFLEGDDGAGAGGAGGAGGTEGGKQQDPPKTFTQADIDRLIGQTRKEEQKKFEDLKTYIEQMQERLKISEADREKSQQEILEIQTAKLTEKQKLELDLQNWQKKHKNDTEKLTGEATTWRERYEQQLLDTAVAGAANTHGAFSKDQLLAMFKLYGARVKPQVVDGKETGFFETRVTFPDKDKEGKPIQVDLTIEDAVKRMTELPEYQNMFKPNQNEGTGGRNSGGSKGSATIAAAANLGPNDFEAYEKMRDANPEAFGG